MPEGLMLTLVFVAAGVLYLIVSSIGNKIVDKGTDAIENGIKRKKNSETESKRENLADRYRR